MEMNYNEVRGTGAAAGGSEPIQPGTILGGRFQIERLQGVGGLGELYSAIDLESQKPVAVRVVAADICGDPVTLEAIREQIRAASALQHKNIASVFGMGKESGVHFIAMEYVEGRTLRHLLVKKRDSGKTFSLKGAYNVLAHVCNALQHAHDLMLHGLPGPGSVLINRVGRVKVCDFGVTRALPPQSEAVARLGDRYCMAPEMEVAPADAGPAADIYTLGALLHELLTGQPPSSPPSPPSAMVQGLTPAVDAVVMRCLQADPSQRYASAKELKSAFYEAMTQAETAVPEEAVHGEPAQPAPRPPQRPQPQPAPAPAQQVQQPSAPPAGFPAPQPAQPMAQAPIAPPPAQPPAPAAPSRPVSMEDLLAETDDGAEKWLIQKDRLDFGPFSMGDLKQQLYRGEFTGDDMVVDQETGERSRIRAHSAYRDFIVHLERHLETQRAHEAEASRVHRDKRRRAILVSVVAGSLAVLGAGGAIVAYYMTREPETREKIIYREKEQDLDGLIKGLQITWKKEPEDQAKQRRSNTKRKRRRGRSGTDDNVTRLGDATEEGGDALLSQTVVQRVMTANFKPLTACVYAELKRDSSLRAVLIDFGVKGDGGVSYVKVNGQASGPFQACIARKMRGIKFPVYDGKLTRASFSMSLQR